MYIQKKSRDDLIDMHNTHVNSDILEVTNVE